MSVPGWVREQMRVHRERSESRLAALARVLPSADGPVLVMMANAGYRDLFTNWVRSCERAGVDARNWAVLLGTDEDVVVHAEQLGFRTFFDPESYGVMPENSVRVFGDNDFRRLMFPKTAIVQDVLQLNRDVLFQDVDVVWNRDPRPLLVPREGEDWDARFMYDGKNPIHGPLHVNTGFFYLRNTPAVRRFWSQVLDEYPQVIKCGSQQRVVNQVLAEGGVEVQMLSEQTFTNGHLLRAKAPWRMPPNPAVIHCSWTGNWQQKLDKYRMAGLWYL